MLETATPHSTPTNEQAFKDFRDSLAVPIITTLITLLGVAAFREQPEAIRFIAQGGATATVIFAADSGRRFSRYRRTSNSNNA
jgi:hypothetical protein